MILNCQLSLKHLQAEGNVSSQILLYPVFFRGSRLQSMGLLESDTTERLHFHFSLGCIGEGNGNPLQCSCLENPRDGKPGGLPSMDRMESDMTEAT